MPIEFSRAAASRVGKNGGRARAAGFLVYLDGKPYRVPQLAKLAGVAQSTMCNRVTGLRKAGIPLTHESLKVPR